MGEVVVVCWEEEAFCLRWYIDGLEEALLRVGGEDGWSGMSLVRDMTSENQM